jgi:hypothetical protein
VSIGFRTRPGGNNWLLKVAEKAGVTKSDVIRAALKVARAHEREVLTALRED